MSVNFVGEMPKTVLDWVATVGLGILGAAVLIALFGLFVHLCGSPEDAALRELFVRADANWICTTEQLVHRRADPLGCEGAVIRDKDGEIFEANDDGSWSVVGADYCRQPRLPALLIWHPDWSKP